MMQFSLSKDILGFGTRNCYEEGKVTCVPYYIKWFALAPTHHCAMSVGHNAALFEKVAQLLGVEFRRVEKSPPA